MKTTALLFSLLFLAACASPTAVIDKHRFDCGQGGHEVSIGAGFENPHKTESLDEPAFLVEVGNNSHQEITVTTVRIEPGNKNRVRYQSTADVEDVVIAEGDAHVFRLPARIALAPDPEIAPSRIPHSDDFLEFSVLVMLTNGDEYRCGFRAMVDR